MIGKKRANSTPCSFEEVREAGKIEMNVNKTEIIREGIELTRSRVVHLLDDEIKYLTHINESKYNEKALEVLENGRIIIEDDVLPTN